MTKDLYDIYLKILKDELVPAMGCTEPIAIAYAAALAKKTLGTEIEKVVIKASANIIKNVKSVVVPNTGGKKGILSAVASAVEAGLLGWQMQQQNTQFYGGDMSGIALLIL